MEIKVNDQIYLSDIREIDAFAYITHFKEKEIYDLTIEIPYPYGEREAQWWIKAVGEEAKKFGKPLQWAIRNQEGCLIGGIGLLEVKSINTHLAEVGFFLAKPYWGKGITTNVVRAFSNYVFEEYEIVRLFARVFSHNHAAKRVLQKCDYLMEGHMKKRYLKDGKYIDADIYALVR